MFERRPLAGVSIARRAPRPTAAFAGPPGASRGAARAHCAPPAVVGHGRGVVLAIAEPMRAGLQPASPLASRRAALWVVRRDLDDDDRESVGITGHHLDQAPGLARRLLLDRDIGGGELSPLALHVAHLKQQPDNVGRRPAGGSRDLEQAGANEEHNAAVRSAAPLAKDGQAERLAVEAQRALEVTGVQQDSAGEDLHAERIAAAEIPRARARPQLTPARAEFDDALRHGRRLRAEGDRDVARTPHAAR